MSKTRVLAVAAVGLLTLTYAGSALAGPSQVNNGTFAYLAWSATDTTKTDLVGNAATANLYLIYRKPEGLTFKGGEIDITWTPPGDPGSGCFEHTGTSTKTSTLCTYLNRGTAVPIVLFDDPGHFHQVWANNMFSTGCTLGAGIQISFEFDLCATSTPNGVITLNYVNLIDDKNDVNDSISQADGGYGGVTLQQPVVTVNATPVQPTTWGAIKRQYAR